MSLMGRDLSLAPCGLVVERVETEAEGLLILARPASTTAVCPTCGSASARIHSTYRRMLADLPAQGRAVRISVSTRRFRWPYRSARGRSRSWQCRVPKGGPARYYVASATKAKRHPDT